ncbi:hypothetical protein [Brevibacillus reuszeri]|uniref:hypothetical protein n=1 Tax=Brevibacillus reuszeri TaxID=54915 RepID=UPI000CCBDC14|nr:hypothetical protein [Brevibacillus reuszeri]
MQAGRDAEKDLAMCEAATSGPWEWGMLNRFIMGGDTVVASVVDGDEVTGPHVYLTDNDAQFVTEFREALPYWIQRAVAAEAEVERLKAENVRVVALSGSGYEKLVQTLQYIEDETKDPGSRLFAKKVLREIRAAT